MKNKTHNNSTLEKLFESEANLLIIRILSLPLDFLLAIMSLASFFIIIMMFVTKQPITPNDSYFFMSAFIAAFIRICIDRYTQRLKKQNRKLRAKLDMSEEQELPYMTMPNGSIESLAKRHKKSREK